METARLSPLYEFKATDTDGTGLFAGYASTFGGTPDAYGDIVAPGAFADTLSDHKAAGTMPALLWAHDQNEPIGRFVEMKESAEGLEVVGKLTLGTKRGQEAYQLMKDGALSLSIGYGIAPGGAEETRAGRLLKNIKLFEVSAVALPANHRARITAVKSAPQTAREFEAVLRDVAGFSSRQAKALASHGWAALQARDEHADEASEIASLLTQYQTLLKGK